MQRFQECLYELKFMPDYNPFISIYVKKIYKNTMNKAKT